jgi:hypothetical protein
MNLRVKRVGQLAMLAIALFFLSCEDGTSLLGYENPTSKFDLSFIDIPVETSVIQLDSIRTSNFNASNDLNRLLVGKTDDARFGDATAIAFTQFLPKSGLDTSVTNHTPVFDSISLQLRHDYYAYGANGNTHQEINVHELTEALKSSFSTTTTTNTGGQQKPHTTTYNFQKTYLSKDVATFDPTMLGTKGFNVDKDKYKLGAADATPDTVYTTIPLSDAFGQRLFNLATTASKTDFTNYTYFTERFKGLVLTPGESDKIIGIRPGDDFTKLVMHLHTTKDTLTIEFSLNNLLSFNQITADRSSSELATLTTTYQDTEPNGDLRYIQAGTGVVTKIDFSKFGEFAATLDRVAINSAEFIINGIEDPAGNEPPPNLVVKLLKDNNRIKKPAFRGNSTAFTNDVAQINSYRGYINYDVSSFSNFYSGSVPFDSTLNIINDVGRFCTLNYSETDKKYKGSATLFFQQLFSKTAEETKFTKAVLVPYEGASSSYPYGRHVIGKSLNRVVFNKNNIVLRVYYTVPTVN